MVTNPNRADPTRSFRNALVAELDAVNFRRQIKCGKRAKKDPDLSVLCDAPSAQGSVIHSTSMFNLAGLALSGGGIRSAAFSLGALQALDAITPSGRSDIIDHMDYLSAVSGGNYTATALATGMMQCNGTFPFESKKDNAETPETKHLRDYSNFLAPKWIDYITNGFVIARGLLVNFVMIVPWLLLLVCLTIIFNPAASDLQAPDILGFELTGWPQWLGTFVIAPVMLAALVLIMIGWTTALSRCTPTLRARERFGKAVAWFLIAVAAAAFAEWQPLIFKAIFTRAPEQAPAQTDALALLQWLADWLGPAGGVFVAVALSLMAFAQKIANVARASLADSSWSGLAKRIMSRLALYAAGLAVPILLWLAYLNLSFWGIRGADGTFAHSPAWLSRLGDASSPLAGAAIFPFSRLGAVGTAYLVAALLLLVLSLFFGPNANSLHKLYRDRLSRAFLLERESTAAGGDAHDPDTWTYSSLKRRDPTSGEWEPGAAFAPYLIVTTAINLQADKYLNERGRNADIFTMTPLNIGSEATGYVDSHLFERRAPDLTLASGMAISGAAASANMGRNTLKALTFSLAVLNIRLGYWLPNPARVTDEFEAERAASNSKKAGPSRLDGGIGPWWFARELFGWITSKSQKVHLTDGGHIDNLGLYELLKRRCRVIIVMDAEADPAMVFSSFAMVQLHARIDLGARIDLPWRAIDASRAAESQGASADRTFSRPEPVHVAVGRIDYGEQDKGLLIYIKSSLTGDENDVIRDYKRRNSEFPHETTVDQFFTEDQFEAYRALGFHATHGFFAGDHPFAVPDGLPPGVFLTELVDGLQMIAVPDPNIQEIINRAAAYVSRA